MSRGGRREGAGRKPESSTGKPKARVTLTLDTELLEWLDNVPGDRSTLVNALLTHMMQASASQE